MQRICAYCNEKYTPSPKLAFCAECYEIIKAECAQDPSARGKWIKVLQSDGQKEADYQRRRAIKLVSYDTLSEYRPDLETVTRIAAWSAADIERFFWDKTTPEAKEIIAKYDRENPAA